MQPQQELTMSQPKEWSTLAKQYKSLGNLSILHAAQALQLLHLTDQDRFVVDVAAGFGAFALQAAHELKRLHPHAAAGAGAGGGGSPKGEGGEVKVLATDFAEAMVEACRFEAQQEGLSDILECKQMDGQDLHAIKDGSVDALGCVFGVMFFPDIVKGLREMHRVLRKGGRAAVVVLKDMATVELMKQLASTLSAHFNLATDRDVAAQVTAMAYKLADPQVFRARLSEAGFTEEQVVSVEPFEDASWTGLELNEGVVGWALDNPIVRACYPPEKRSEAEAIFKQVMAHQKDRLRNQSLIALLQK